MDDGILNESSRQIDVSDDLYIVIEDEYLELHSRSLDTADVTGVIIAEDELDRLIAKLTELKKELDEG